MIQYEFDCSGCDRYVLFETPSAVDAFECPCGEVTMLNEKLRVGSVEEAAG